MTVRWLPIVVMQTGREYDSFTEYLEQHHNIAHEEAIIINKGSFSFKNYYDNSIDVTIQTLNDGEFKKLFSDAVGGIIDENSNWLYY